MMSVWLQSIAGLTRRSDRAIGMESWRLHDFLTSIISALPILGGA